MYGYEYEFDFLLCLRLLKFLHMQSPESAKRVIEIYKEVDTEEIDIVMEEILWDIFSDAESATSTIPSHRHILSRNSQNSHRR